MPGASGRILLVCKLKGGSGATTTCRELCAAALRDGQKVALIDLDGQAGLSRWWNRRTAGEGERPPAPDLLQLTAAQIPGAAAGLRGRYDLTVIDSPPSVHETIRSVAGAADLALVPARPTVDDLDAVGPVVRLLHGTVDHGFVLTQVPPARGSRDGAEALERLATRARAQPALPGDEASEQGQPGDDCSERAARHASTASRLALNSNAAAASMCVEKTAHGPAAARIFFAKSGCGRSSTRSDGQPRSAATMG